MEQRYSSTADICTLFNGMTERDMNAALNCVNCRRVNYSSREIYCLNGEQCRHVDIVQRGELVVRATGMSGRIVEIIRLHKGDMIAPCFILASDQRLPVEIETLTEVTLMRMTQSDLYILIENHTEIRRNFIRMVSDIASFLASRIRFLSLMTIREKLVCYLKGCVAEQRSLHIRLNLSRQSIADIFAVQKYSLMRCLSDLADEGIISVNGKDITILDPKRLR